MAFLIDKKRIKGPSDWMSAYHGAVADVSKRYTSTFNKPKYSEDVPAKTVDISKLPLSVFVKPDTPGGWFSDPEPAGYTPEELGEVSAAIRAQGLPVPPIKGLKDEESGTISQLFGLRGPSKGTPMSGSLEEAMMGYKAEILSAAQKGGADKWYNQGKKGLKAFEYLAGQPKPKVERELLPPVPETEQQLNLRKSIEGEANLLSEQLLRAHPKLAALKDEERIVAKQKIMDAMLAKRAIGEKPKEEEKVEDLSTVSTEDLKKQLGL